MHFQDLVNCESTVDEFVYLKVPRLPVNFELGKEPSLAKVKTGINQMRSRIQAKVSNMEEKNSLAAFIINLILLICHREEITPDLSRRCGNH